MLENSSKTRFLTHTVAMKMNLDECMAVHIRKDNLLDNSEKSMQLYKAVVCLRCIFVLDPVTHRKLQNRPQGELR